jgi:hypothetical protein
VCGVFYPVGLAVSIVQQYLEFFAPEQYIYEYTKSLELNKKRKYYLGNIIKFRVKA